jgi:hypothetical protein
MLRVAPARARFARRGVKIAEKRNRDSWIFVHLQRMTNGYDDIRNNGPSLLRIRAHRASFLIAHCFFHAQAPQLGTYLQPPAFSSGRRQSHRDRIPGALEIYNENPTGIMLTSTAQPFDNAPGPK